MEPAQSTSGDSTYIKEQVDKKRRALILFICLQRQLQQDFNVSLLLSGSRVTIKGLRNNVSKAASLLNHLLGMDIVEQEVGSKFAYWSQFQFFKGLSHGQVMRLSLLHRVLIIPSFFLRQLNQSTCKKESSVLVVGNPGSVSPFLEEYRNIAWAEPVQVFNISQKTFYNHEIVWDIHKYAALRMLNLPNFTFEVISLPGTIILNKQDHQKYMQIQKDYQLQWIQMNTSRWLAACNIVLGQTSRLIHQIEMVSQINKVTKFHSVRREVVFYIRRRSDLPLKKLLQANKITIVPQSVQRTLVLQKRDIADTTKSEFYSRLNRDKSLKTNFERSGDTNYILVNYKSSTNHNELVRSKFDDIRRKTHHRYRYQIKEKMLVCLGRYYYKSILNSLGDKHSFSWEAKSQEQQPTLEIFNCFRNIEEVEPQVEEFLKGMLLCRCIFTLPTRQVFTAVCSQKPGEGIPEIKQQVVFPNPQLNRVTLQGILLKESDRAGIEEDIKEFMRRMDIAQKHVKIQTYCFGTFELTKMKVDQMEELLSYIASNPHDFSQSSLTSLSFLGVGSASTKAG